MKRWFIARMVEIDGEIMPKVATYPNVNHRTWSKDGFAFGMGQLATNNLTQFDNDNDIRLIPDAALDNMLSTIPSSVRLAMKDQLIAAGFSVQGLVWTWTIRRLLKHLKLQLQTDDDIETGDVRDVEG